MIGMPPEAYGSWVVLISGLIGRAPLLYGLITSARALGKSSRTPRRLRRRRRERMDSGRMLRDAAGDPRAARGCSCRGGYPIRSPHHGSRFSATTPLPQAAFVLALLTLVLLVALWRNAANLQGHARAAADQADLFASAGCASVWPPPMARSDETKLARGCETPCCPDS